MRHALQESRASIDTIKAHPWFNKPLLEKYEIALKVREAGCGDSARTATRQCLRRQALLQVTPESTHDGQ